MLPVLLKVLLPLTDVANPAVATCKLATWVVDVTVNGAVPVERSDSNVSALNSCAPISKSPPAVNDVIPSTVPPLISTVVKIPKLALILPEAVICWPRINPPSTVKTVTEPSLPLN